jgi:hypothetical protein
MAFAAGGGANATLPMTPSVNSVTGPQTRTAEEFDVLFDKLFRGAVSVTIKQPAPEVVFAVRAAVNQIHEETVALLQQRRKSTYLELYHDLKANAPGVNTRFQREWESLVRSAGNARFGIVAQKQVDLLALLSPSMPLSTLRELETRLLGLHLPTIQHVSANALHEEAVRTATALNIERARSVFLQYAAAVSAYIEYAQANAWVNESDRVCLRPEIADSKAVIPDVFYLSAFATAFPPLERPDVTKEMRDAIRVCLKTKLTPAERLQLRGKYAPLIDSIQHRLQSCQKQQEHAKASLDRAIDVYASGLIALRARTLLHQQMLSDIGVINHISGILSSSTSFKDTSIVLPPALVEVQRLATRASESLASVAERTRKKITDTTPTTLECNKVVAAWLGYISARVDLCDAETLAHDAKSAFSDGVAPSAQEWSPDAFQKSLEAECNALIHSLRERVSKPIGDALIGTHKTDIATMTLPTVRQWNQYWSADAKARSVYLHKHLINADAALTQVEYVRAPADQLVRGAIGWWASGVSSRSTKQLKVRGLTIPTAQFGPGLVSAYLDNLLIPSSPGGLSAEDCVRCALVIYACEVKSETLLKQIR